MLAEIWFFLWALLWVLYFILDGFDLGAAILIPFVGKDENGNGQIIKSLAPVWDGNEVWLVTAGGAMFAAFPKGYATMFSFFYSPLMLVLIALIIRGVSIEFRYHPISSLWLKICDWSAALSSLVVAFGLGALFSNIFAGIPISGSGLQNTNYNFFNLYAVIGGLFFIGLFLVQGGTYLTLKLSGDIEERVKNMTKSLFGYLLFITFLFIIFTYFKTNLFANYFASPALMIVISGLLLILVALGLNIYKQNFGRAFTLSTLYIATVSLFAFIGLYPRLIPSSIADVNSLTIYNSSSSPMTLAIMLGVVLLFIPLVIIYQSWTHYIFRERVSDSSDLH